MQFMPAYALTIFTAQGQTIDKCIVWLDSPVLAPGVVMLPCHGIGSWKTYALWFEFGAVKLYLSACETPLFLFGTQVLQNLL